MKVKTHGHQMIVRWHHLRDQSNGTTVCEIEGYAKNLTGKSWCSSLDQYDKNVGRKKSLARAIKNLPVKMRMEFWKEYDNEIGLVRGKKGKTLHV